MQIVPASDSSLIVVFGDAISLALNQRVMALFGALMELKDSHIRNLHPGYASILIDFDPLQFSHNQLAAQVRQLTDVARLSQRPATVVTVPVCYDPEFGPDLADVAAHAKISVEEAIRLHCSATYIVYFLGFSPGFAYLGGLPPILHTPRLPTPRRYVAAGTVGIGGTQTGVYPVDSPGGWRLIGRTPWRMFDPAASPPTRLQAGDVVRFLPVDRPTFNAATNDNARNHSH